MFLFVSQFFKNIRHTGSVWPSSRALARVMTTPLRRNGGPRRILEVGPGTGSLTRTILGSLRPGDELHIVEINPAFCRSLESKLLRPFRTVHPDIVVELHAAPIESSLLSGTFHCIVCSLPFNNFQPTQVRAIFKRLLGLLAEGGELTYFEYAGARTAKSPFVSPEGRRRLRLIGVTGRVLSRRHHGQRRMVWANFPPAISMRLLRC